MKQKREVEYKDTHADENKIKINICGAISAVVSRTAMAPLYRTTILFQVQNMKTAGIPESYTKSIFSALNSTIKNEGFQGLFKGNWTHLVKKVPFASIKFYSYERYKQLLTPGNKEEANVILRFVSGSLAAVTACVITYPLDMVQTQLATQTLQKKYTGIINTLVTIPKEEGFLQLYRGLTATIMSQVPYISLNMTIWETLKRKVSHYLYGDKKLHPLVSSGCGAISGAVASTIVFPLDVIRRHIQLNRKMNKQEVVYTGYLDVIKYIKNKNGIKGFYRGIGPHYLTVIPNVAISLGVYDAMKLLLGVT